MLLQDSRYGAQIKITALCRFIDRCPLANDKCKTQDLAKAVITGKHSIMCHNFMNSYPVKEQKKLHKPEIEDKTILAVNKYNVNYPIRSKLIKRVIGYTDAVKDICFNLSEGESLAIVGGS